MKLYIDPTGGIAGDMFASLLVSAGADKQKVIDAILYAANKLGKATAKFKITKDGSHQLILDLENNHSHLHEHKAIHLLDEIIFELKIEEKYAVFGKKVLDILLKAEKQAHSENTFLTDHIQQHNHHHSHGHHHNETTLHEAQDILIDITGAMVAMQNLKIETTVFLLKPVSVGGGRIIFSHGNLPVPAPATNIILKKYNIPWQFGPIEKELCTPTGAAILAGLNCKLCENVKFESSNGFSRGSKILDIPPLKAYI